MTVGKILYLLAQGFIIGYGPCLAVCLPILLPYIGGTRRTWQDGLAATLYFSLTRLFVYVILGGASGYIGAYLLTFYYNNNVSFYLWSIGAGLLIVIGILIMLGRNIDLGLCHILPRKFLVDHPSAGMMTLGLLVGLSPCLPLMGILLEIAILAPNFGVGALYGFFFGIGTVVSPMLLVGALTPVLAGRISDRPLLYKLFTVLCGLTMVGLGAYIVLLRGSI